MSAGEVFPCSCVTGARAELGGSGVVGIFRTRVGGFRMTVSVRALSLILCVGGLFRARNKVFLVRVSIPCLLERHVYPPAQNWRFYGAKILLLKML
jgi:hypothetical protein